MALRGGYIGGEQREGRYCKESVLWSPVPSCGSTPGNGINPSPAAQGRDGVNRASVAAAVRVGTASRLQLNFYGIYSPKLASFWLICWTRCLAASCEVLHSVWIHPCIRTDTPDLFRDGLRKCPGQQFSCQIRFLLSLLVTPLGVVWHLLWLQ